MRLLYTAAIIGSILASPVAAKEKAPPPSEPSEKPDLAAFAKRAERSVTASLYDPSSAEIIYTSGFQWGYLKPIIGRRTYGWIACATLNGKNRMGGYVGASPLVLFIDAKGVETINTANDIISTCDNGPKAEVQSYLVNVKPTMATTVVNQISPADELAKLAKLKDAGVITQAEFDAQKKKLLGL